MSDSKINLEGRKRSLANLKPAKKGEPSRNPKGRPKKEVCFPDILRRILDEPSPMNQKISNYEMIASVAINQASKGDHNARNWIADRAEGKAIDRIIQKFDDDELIIL